MPLIFLGLCNLLFVSLTKSTHGTFINVTKILFELSYCSSGFIFTGVLSNNKFVLVREYCLYFPLLLVLLLLWMLSPIWTKSSEIRKWIQKLLYWQIQFERNSKWKNGYMIYLPSILVNCFLRLKPLEKKVSFVKAIVLNFRLGL